MSRKAINALFAVNTLTVRKIQSGTKKDSRNFVQKQSCNENEKYLKTRAGRNFVFFVCVCVCVCVCVQQQVQYW